MDRAGHPSRTTAADRPAHRAAPAHTTAASPAGSRRSAHTAPTAAGPRRPVRVPLTVLNNTTVTGLAHSAAQDFESHGWRVSQVSNYTGRLAATTVFYRDGDAAQRRAARALAAQFPGIAQVAPTSTALSPGSGLTVVLAPDWSTS